MKKFFNTFFVTLGVIFFIIILFGLYFLIADPFDIKPILKLYNPEIKASPSAGTVDKNPLLNAEQEQTLEFFGVDPAALPSQISPAMEDCFVETLGQTRVDQITQGDGPSIADFFQARSCLDE